MTNGPHSEYRRAKRRRAVHEGVRLRVRVVGLEEHVLEQMREKLDAEPWRDQVEVVQADVMEPDSLGPAFEGVHAAYYLVHSIGAGDRWEERDRQAAENFRDAAAAAGAAQIAKVLKEFLAEEPEDENAPTIPEKLSKRQKQLLVMLDRGLSNRDIAEQLQISEHTVKVHLWRLFRRLNVKSRSQASHLARTAGLLDL